MAVRPPGGNSDTSTTIEFGIAALDAQLEEADVSFPVTDDELVETLDDPDIAVGPGGSQIALSDALARTERGDFESAQALMNELHPIFEAEREGVSDGLVASLRDLLPF